MANYALALTHVDTTAACLDPDFALALALAAHCHHTRCAQGWAGGDGSDEVAAVRLAEAALAKAPDDPEVLTHAANARAFYGRGLAPSLQLVERALELNPNFAWFVGGWLRLHCGQPDRAIERFARALRLSPLDPMASGNAAAASAQAHLLRGDVEAAVAWASRAVREAADYAFPHRVLVAALAQAGREREPVAAAQDLLRLEPGFTVEAYVRRTRLRHSPALRQLTAGLRLGGLREA